jgi:phage tail-like protein
MTDKNGTTQSIQTWPVPEFHFSVEISNVGKIFCKEVSGLDVEFDVIEYRPGDMPGFTRGKMPGLRKGGDVTLKKAILKDDKTLWDWINQVKINIIQRESVTIALIDESGIPVHSWKLTNAWPQKYTMGGFKADGSGVSMENIVLAHESITPD